MLQDKINQIINNKELNSEVQSNQLTTLSTDTIIRFAIWLRTNYSINEGHQSLPKGIWRENNSDRTYTVNYLWIKFNESL